MNYSVMDSPIGKLTIVERDSALAAVYMEQHRHTPDPARWGRRVDDALPEATRQLREYFAQQRRVFNLPLFDGVGTSFQRMVWAALRTIPYGQTWTYGQLAAAVGRPSAARAIGLANSRNPVSIVVPCHRVVRADGSLTGYAGGTERKRFLLDLEHDQRPLDKGSRCPR